MPRDVEKISRLEADLFDNIKCHLLFFSQIADTQLILPLRTWIIQDISCVHWSRKWKNQFGKERTGLEAQILDLRQNHALNQSFFPASMKHRCGCVSISCLLGDIQSDHSTSDKLWGQAEHILYPVENWEVWWSNSLKNQAAYWKHPCPCMSGAYPQALKLDQVTQPKNVKITKEILWRNRNKTLFVLSPQGLLSSFVAVIHFVQI